MTQLATALYITEQVLVLMIIVRAFMSFFPRIDAYHPVVRFLDSVCEPILGVFRRLLPPMGGIDFSPILAILVIQVVASLLINLLNGAAR